ncbi:MAG: hypothetical protein QXR53_01675 [Candidatus Norongarragalinales archaeon]
MEKKRGVTLSEHGHPRDEPAAFSKSVEEVAGAEEHAKKILAKAQEQASETVAKARQKASEIVSNAELEAEEKREAIVNAKKAEVEAENSKILAEAHTKAAEIKKKGFKQLASKLAKEILPPH